MNKYTPLITIIILFALANLALFYFDDNYDFDGFKIVKAKK